MTGRSRLGQVALLGNAMGWFGSAVFVLALATEHIDALTGGVPARLAGFVLLLTVGAGLLAGGVLDQRHIRQGRPDRT